MPPTHSTEKTLPLYFTSALVNFLGRYGVAADALLQDTNLDMDTLNRPETRTSFETINTIIHRGLAAWGRPGLGRDFGTSLTIPSLGILGQAAATCDTMGDGLRTIVRYLAIRQPMLQFHTRETPQGAWFVLEENSQLGDARSFVAEAALHATLSFAEQLAASDLDGHRFAFRMSSQDAGYGGPPYDFCDSRDALFLPLSALEMPVPTASPINAAEAKRLCEAEIRALQRHTGLKGAIRELILSRLSNPPTEIDAAQLLGVSERNLRRKLREQGTTFRAILQATRAEMAAHYLQLGHLRIGQIATELGYENVGNFSRAYKRWTGQNPSQARAQSKSE